MARSLEGRRAVTVGKGGAGGAWQLARLQGTHQPTCRGKSAKNASGLEPERTGYAAGTKNGWECEGSKWGGGGTIQT